MILRVLVIVLVWISTSVSAATTDGIFAFKSSDAVVYDDNGAALFRAQPDFILAHVKNPDARIFGWNQALRLVRINAAGKPGIWLSCNELMPIAGKCAATSASGNQSIRNGNSRGNLRPSNRPSSAVPMCPGDPRCPVF